MTPYLEGLVKETRADYAAGETSGPFSNVTDLMKHLYSKSMQKRSY